MTEQASAAQPRAPVKAGVGAAAIVAAAVAGVASFTAGQEGTVYRAYLDPARVPTICEGHTTGVKLGQIATPAQCRAFYVADMTAKMQAVLRITPALAQHKGPLEAAGDLAFNGGAGRYQSGPMRALFDKGSWAAGCNAFAGFLTLYKAPKPVSGHRCVRNKAGVLYCEAPALVTRRRLERALCLEGLSVSSPA